MQRAVVAGCGRISTRFLTAAREAGGTEVVGLADLRLDAAEQRRAEFEYGNAVVGTDYLTMIERLRPDIVFDLAVPAARHDIVTTSLRRGCHVLTEKPMADSMARARDLIAAARDAGRIHAVVQNRRYVGGIRRIARFLRSGAIGEVTALYCDFFVAPHPGGFREQMEHVLLLDMAIHTFDAARLFAGAEAAAVHCREWNPPGSWFAHGASAIATFEMRNGVVFGYRGCWCAEGFRTSWESVWRITGTRGTLIWDGEDDIRAEVAVGVPENQFRPLEAVPVPPLAPGDRIGGHRGVIEDFVQAIRAGGQPETAGTDNIHSLAMVFGAIESATAGRTVPVE